VARPWELDITLRCPRCSRTVDATIQVLSRVDQDVTAICPYCKTAIVHGAARGYPRPTEKRD
jgi:endogenous inhibitor of DNA gyrase (YacG/DUF329 family)